MKISPKDYPYGRIRTELSFNGDIRDLKKFLLKNAKIFPEPQLREVSRDIPNKLRQRVIARDNNVCQLCGKEGEEIDHIVPFCVGGKHEEGNLRVVCSSCNKSEAAKMRYLTIKKDNDNPIKIEEN